MLTLPSTQTAPTSKALPTTPPYLVLSLLDVLEGRCPLPAFALGLLPGSGSLPQSTCLPWRLGSSLPCSSRKPLMYLAILLLWACVPGSVPVWVPRPSVPCILRGLHTKHSTVRMPLCRALLASASLQGQEEPATCTRKAACSEEFCPLQPLRLLSHGVAWATREGPGQFSFLGV